jgi:hypothetical protein
VSRFRRVLDRLGGPGAVTWWAFFISLVDRLITVSVQPVNTTVPFGTRIAITVIAQVVMFVPLVILRFTLLKDPARPRPWVALAGLALAAVVRGVVVDQLFHAWGGLPLYPELRILSGFLPTIIPLLITAYVVNTLRERRQQLAALLEIRDRLTASRNQAEEEIQQRNEDLVVRVRTVMDRELAELSAEQAVGAVEQLQRTASEVVRPLSHELATSFASQEAPAPAIRPIRLGWRQVVGDASLDRPLAPLITTLLIVGIFIPAAIAIPRARLAVILSLPILFLTLIAANALLRRLLPRMNSLGRLVTVGSACLATALITGGFVRLLVGDWSSASAITTAAVFYVLIMSIGMALINGVLASRKALVADTALANEEVRAQVLRTRQLQWFHQRALARALHGPVQSAVTASALRLATELQNGPISADLVDSIRTDLVQVLDVLHAPQHDVAPFDDGIARIVMTWEGLCEVHIRVEDDVAGVIFDDPVTRACIIDILTDGVSNAVRHGKASSVTVSISNVAETVVIDVEDNGQVPLIGPGRGLGSALLDECALTWSLTDTGSGHVLRAVLPVIPAPASHGRDRAP